MNSCSLLSLHQSTLMSSKDLPERARLSMPTYQVISCVVFAVCFNTPGDLMCTVVFAVWCSFCFCLLCPECAKLNMHYLSIDAFVTSLCGLFPGEYSSVRSVRNLGTILHIEYFSCPRCTPKFHQDPKVLSLLLIDLYIDLITLR